ncbi:MAG: site-specific DNA-methyltransferase [Candidatus Schekmanbacteria bacterium]|nr:site-specific DNA-methyltransferase [Candidatus Schekmanbacteria bacterium]
MATRKTKHKTCRQTQIYEEQSTYIVKIPRKQRASTVAAARKYAVKFVSDAKSIAAGWLKTFKLENAVRFGLPEVDDRYHIWRVPLVKAGKKERIGEVVIDAYTSLVSTDETTAPDVLEARLLGRNETEKLAQKENGNASQMLLSFVRNAVILGDCEQALLDMPSQSVDLIFTSPPYYNARPEYEDYLSYESYLLKMRRIIHNCHRVLSEGRFFVMNISPVLIRRASRSEASRRIAVPFDMHRIFVEEGFDFIDDIHWVKPEGAGWATGRGRRFAADRQPLQYKAVPVTEYVLVYRKHTDKLIDWNIRNHPDQQAVKNSKISGEYETTNLWRVHPAFHAEHPAVFPVELAKRVIRYYSFINDVVLDPFAGIGTTGRASAILNRRFVLIENEPKYIEIIRKEITDWLGMAAKDVLFVGCQPPDTSSILL